MALRGSQCSTETALGPHFCQRNEDCTVIGNSTVGGSIHFGDVSLEYVSSKSAQF